jgi:hypothetical protein
MEPVFVIGFIILAIAIRLIAGSFDGERVEQHLRDMGCELIDKSWDPFGPGWFGEKGSIGLSMNRSASFQAAVD